MSQAFSLYSELTVRQNLVLHAQLFHVPEDEIEPRVSKRWPQRFGLDEIMEALPDSLPLGQRQRLPLAVALIHKPDLLILDEPTSGVDPVARDGFWEHLIDLSRRDKVTIFISTHFINEAERCDRISLMSAGKVLVVDTPAGVVEKRGAQDAGRGVHRLPGGRGRRQASREKPDGAAADATTPVAVPPRPSTAATAPDGLVQPPADAGLHPPRGDGAEPRPDPPDDGGLGSVILMIIMGYGISLDVEHLKYAVLDRDQTTVSRDYALNMPARATSSSSRRSPTTRSSTGGWSAAS